ncbi:MAG: quinone-dependent dihydroorotate dehydrogenase [Gammaproteobacteria bacterium]
MFYSLIRPLLFALSPHTAHRVALRSLHVLSALKGFHAPERTNGPPHEYFGLRFANRVGLAAGFDKSGRYVDDLAQLGFGFIEVGTVTPRPQPGNPPPNLFRLVEDRALINRMGFNNDGVEATVRRLEKRRYRGVCGVNIGKNFDTPLENATSDYLKCLRAAYATADYVTVNVSSPNTPGLRDLQGEESLDRLLADLVNEREKLSGVHSKRAPLLVKIAPDLDTGGVRSICRVLLRSGVDGVVATNTTIARPPSLRSRAAGEVGGLSGAPLHEPSMGVIRMLRERLGSALPIVGVGGISSSAEARATREAGAGLIQLYTGFIYEGPALIDDLIRDDSAPDERRGPQSPGGLERSDSAQSPRS